MLKIQGCVALVTGSSRGLGLAYCHGLLRAGATKVYAAARDPSKFALHHPGRRRGVQAEEPLAQHRLCGTKPMCNGSSVAGYSSVSCSLVSIGAAVGLSMLWVGRIMALGLLASLGGAIQPIRSVEW